MRPFRSQRTIAGLIQLSMLVMAQLFTLAGWAADKGQVILLFYDRDGVPSPSTRSATCQTTGLPTGTMISWLIL